MTTTSWTSPSATATGISGDIAWTDDDNAQADDGANASAALGASDTSEYLQAQDFGFAIPTGATIDLVEVRIDRSKTGSGLPNLLDIQLMQGDFGNAASLKGDPDSWSGTGWWSTSGFGEFGGSGDTWNGYLASLTAELINGSNFGFALKASNSGFSATCLVDVMQMRITYTEAVDTSAEDLAWAMPRSSPVVRQGRGRFTARRATSNALWQDFQGAVEHPVLPDVFAVQATRLPPRKPRPSPRTRTPRPWQDFSPPVETPAVIDLVANDVLRPRPRPKRPLGAWARSWQPIDPPAPVETVIETPAVLLTPVMRPPGLRRRAADRSDRAWLKKLCIAPSPDPDPDPPCSCPGSASIEFLLGSVTLEVIESTLSPFSADLELVGPGSVELELGCDC